MSTTRREFFAYGGAGALGAALAAGVGAGLGPASALARQPVKKLKFRVGGRTGTIGRSGPEALAHAKKLGLEGIEIEAQERGRDPGDRLSSWDPGLQKQFLAEAEKTGVVVASTCIGHFNRYPVFADPRAKRWLEGTIDATKALNAKVILVPFFGSAGDMRIKGTSRPDPAKRDKAIEVLKSVAEKAESTGISLALENTLSAEDNMYMVEKVGSPAVRVYYDIGNSTNNGYDVPKEIRMLGNNLIAQFHFKDRGTLLGQGQVDMAQVAAAVRDIDYEGWIVLETSKVEPLGTDGSATYNAGFIRGLLCG